MKLGRYLRKLGLATASVALSLLPNYSCSSLRAIECPSTGYASEELGVPESSILWIDSGYATTESAYRIIRRVARERNGSDGYAAGVNHNGFRNEGFNPPGNDMEEDIRRAVVDADFMGKRDKVITFGEACALSKAERGIGRK
jgi:hypothetical protein